jgi:hypothetical protein
MFRIKERKTVLNVINYMINRTYTKNEVELRVKPLKLKAFQKFHFESYYHSMLYSLWN